MDRLNLTTSVIRVIQLAESCLKLSRKWVDPSESCSSTHLTSLITILYNFDGALKAFQTHLEIYKDDEARLNSLEIIKLILVYCEESLNIIKSFMENSSGSVDKQSVGSKFDCKLKPSFNTLNRAQRLFVLALHADQRTILLKVEQFAEDLRDINNDIPDRLKRLREGGDEIYTLEVKKARTEQQRQDATTKSVKAVDIAAAVDRARRDFKICPNRIWGVARSLPGREENLPLLIPRTEVLKPREPHENHDQCTFDFCEYSHRDFTSVLQRHELSRCSGQWCGPLRNQFPRQELVRAINAGNLTAWKLEGGTMIEPPQPY